MRVRLIRPGYWTDADLQTRLTADVREFYIGLWMQADDAGYIAWDIVRIGADLYPYRSLPWRQKHMNDWVALLSINDHVRLLDCGQHAVVPNLPKYQSPPKPSFQNQRAHDACLRQVAPGGAIGGQVAPAQEGKGVKKGREFKGGAHAHENGQDGGGLRERIGSFEDVMATSGQDAKTEDAW